MKIAIVVPGGVDRSGTHRVIPCILWLIERLAKGGDEVHVFALYQEPRPGQWPLLGAIVHNAGAKPHRLRALAQMRAEHKRSRFDIIHAYWAGPSGQVACTFGAIIGVPVIVTLPGGDLAALRDIGYGGRLTWRGRLSSRFTLAMASRVTVPTHWLGKQVTALGVRSERLPYGVALDRWPPQPPRPRDLGSKLRLIHIADLNRVKDQPTLLKAARLLRDRGLDFVLDIVGMDTLGDEIQRLAASLRLDDHVRFHGFLPQTEMRHLVEQADLLMISSRHEGVPIAVLEAAVVGVPTVGTAVGQIVDWAPEGAVAVPVGDFEALAGAVEALARDDETRLRLAYHAQRQAVAEDADATVQLTRNLYASLVAR
jgi:glycosyltransferase involved in cell wall biosynthesis